ncbi:hypothetical protein [Uruburuella testudinis]|nr:hypothetical protein [Uruburuella testudinis]
MSGVYATILLTIIARSNASQAFADRLRPSENGKVQFQTALF